MPTPAALAALIAPALVAQTPVDAAAPADPHPAALHPADADLFFATPSLPDLIAAYDTTAIAAVLRDEDLDAAVEELSGGAFHLSALDADFVWRNLSAALPPELEPMGVLDAVRDTTGVSGSIVVPPDLEARLAALAPLLEGDAAIEAVETEVEFERFRTDEIPEDLSLLDEPNDPWGRPWIYERDGEGGFTVRSLGADGEPGGEGADADLSSSASLATEPLVELLREFRIQVVLEFGSPASAELLSGLALQSLGDDGALPPGLAVEFGGRDVGGARLDTVDATFEEDGLLVDVWFAAFGNHLALGVGGDSSGYAARVTGESGGLASQPDYVATSARLAAPGGPVAMESFSRISLPGLQATIQRPLLAVDPELQDIPDFLVDGLEVLLGRFDLRTPPTRSRTTLEGGRYVTNRFRAAAETGAAPLVGGRPISREVFADLPENAAIVWTAALDAPALLELGLEVAAGALETDPAALRAECEEALEISLEADLLALLDEQVLISSGPIRGIAAPEVVTVVRIVEPDRFAASLDAVLGYLGERFPERLEVRARDYRKMPYWYVNLRDEVLSFVQPSFGIVDDRLVVGVKGVHVKRELKRFREGETFAHPLQGDALAWSDDVTSALYLDWGALFDGVYSAVKTFGALAGGYSGGELPIDFGALPDAEVVTRHLAPTLSTTRRVDGGALTVSESSFGPELPFAALLGGIGAGLMVARVEESSDPVLFDLDESDNGLSTGSGAGGSGEGRGVTDDGSAARDATRDALISVRTGLQVFHYDQGGRYPANLEALLEPSEAFPDGFLGRGAIPADGWGHALRYRPAADGTSYELWSTGPDGVDQDGGGDDVRL